ncbi:hypothetical protein C1646_817936 [Rhizophagus diaphanus]|nr:hypothetical protein C1646_817936 [Rhizophagus diaphanus] [Rhizophagus sp. MUCL 43196]
MKSSVPVEILQNIFENYKDDIKTLHSILLVSRYWARIVVVILWRYSLEFARTFTSNCVSKKLLDVYRRYINSEELLFDYPSFLKRLDWKYLKYEHDGKQIFQMLLQKSKYLSYLTIDLYNENIGIYENFDIILNEEILNNISLKKIKFLEISDLIPKNLTILSKICDCIETLIIECVRQNQKEISKLLQIQHNLKNLIITNSFPSFDKSLLKFHTLSLTNIKFVNRNENYTIHSLDILQACTRLENLEFYKWNIYPEECQELSKIHFPNLKSLKFEYSVLPFTVLKGIIEVNGSNLEKLWFIYENYEETELESLSITINQSCRQLSSLTLQICQDRTRKYRNFIVHLGGILQRLKYFTFKEHIFESPINIANVLIIVKRFI